MKVLHSTCFLGLIMSLNHSLFICATSVLNSSIDLELFTNKSSATICTYDEIALRVSWQEIRSKRSPDMQPYLWLALQFADDKRVPHVHHPMSVEITKKPPNKFNPPMARKPILKCEFDTEFCIPEIRAIRLPENIDAKIGIGDKVFVLFKNEVQPIDVSSKQAIDRFLYVSEPFGQEFAGKWINKKTLEIEVTAVNHDQQKFIKELLNSLDARLLHTFEDDDIEGQVQFCSVEKKIRITSPGTYFLQLIQTIEDKTNRVLNTSISFVISKCTETIVLRPATAVNNGQGSKLESPVFNLRGIAALSGKNALKLPDSEIPKSNNGSWSMMFWLYLRTDSYGSFRTLFYKGPGEQHRTPSAWINPYDRRIALRVSTSIDMDVGMTSKNEIKLKTWTLLTFTFRNCSSDENLTKEIDNDCMVQHKDRSKPNYVISFFMDNILDSKIYVTSLVLPNGGPLSIGKDPWMDGSQGFLYNIRIFDGTISLDSVRDYYKFDVDQACLHDDECTIKDSRMKEISTIIRSIPNFVEILKGSHEDRFQLDYFKALRVPPNEKSGAKKFDQAYNLIKSCSTAEEIIEALDSAGEDGHGEALYLAGLLHLGVSDSLVEFCSPVQIKKRMDILDDINKAVLYFERACLLGHSLSMRYLGIIFNSELSSKLYKNISKTTMSTLMYHYAAMMGDINSCVILGNRYHKGIHVPQDDETACFYYSQASDLANEYYHSKSKQPFHEMNKISEKNEKFVEIGQKGDDDELIQFQQLKADQGDIDSMVAMGDLYYWGARGIVRNHVRAFKYFNMAAVAGSPVAQAAAAGMLLKGEGVKQDNETAVMWYKKAANSGNIRALNGLGYAYFFGGPVPKNQTKALGYFENAANLSKDGDSMFNAGHCYHKGQGTLMNYSKAIEFYEGAARKFGHFDSVYLLGNMYRNGEGLQRSASTSLEYIKPAAEAGEWGKLMRQGFDQYLARNYKQATIYYHQAAEYGYDLAYENLAFLYDRRLPKQYKGHAFKYLLLSAKRNDIDAYLRLGDYYFYGLGEVEKDWKVALWWYSKSSSEDIAQGAYNVGYMHEYGFGTERNWIRAARYYRRALDLSSSPETKFAIYSKVFMFNIKQQLIQNPIYQRVYGTSYWGSDISTSDVTITSLDDVSSWWSNTWVIQKLLTIGYESWNYCMITIFFGFITIVFYFFKYN